MASVEPGWREQHRVRESPGPSQGFLRAGRAVAEKLVEGRLDRTAQFVGAHRAGEGKGREVDRDLVREFAKPCLIRRPMQVCGRIRAPCPDDISGEEAQRRGFEVRIEWTACQEIGEEPPRGVGVHQSIEIVRGQLAADQLRPAGAAERQQRRDGDQSRPGWGPERRAEGGRGKDHDFMVSSFLILIRP